MVKLAHMGLIALVAIASAALLIPGTSLAPAAFAHHGGIHIHQSISQSNECEEAGCSNSASNSVSFN